MIDVGIFSGDILVVDRSLTARHHDLVIACINNEFTVKMLSLMPTMQLEEIAPTKKQIVCSRSFGERITDITALSQAVAEYTARAGEKLREQKQRTSQLTVYITTSCFTDKEPYHSDSATLRFCAQLTIRASY